MQPHPSTSPTSPSLATPSFSKAWWQEGAWALLFLLALLPLLRFLFFAPVTMDYWFFLAKGDRLWELGLSSLGKGNPFVFTAPPQSDFIDKEWLYAAFVWKVFQWTGHEGLVIFRGLVGIATFALLFAIARRLGANAGMTAGVFVFGTYSVLIPRLSIRPHALSYLFFMIMFFWLTTPPKRWHLWATGGLFILWANLHGSFVMAGALLGSVGVWSLAVPWLYQKRDPALADYAAQWRRWWKLLLLLPLLVCINPYGWRLWAILWTFQREISGRPDPFVVPEWVAFSFHDLYAIFLMLITALCFLTWFLPNNPRRSQWLLWMSFAAAIAFSNLRFVGLSFLLVSPILAAQLSRLQHPLLRQATHATFVLVGIVLIAMSWMFASPWHLRPAINPNLQQIAHLLIQHDPQKPKMRLFANLTTAGYLSFRLHRKAHFAYDGNPITPGFWDWSQAYKKALLDPEEFQQYCQTHRCDAVVLRLREPLSMPLASFLTQDSPWKPVFLSLDWIVYANTTRPLPPHLQHRYHLLRPFFDLSHLLRLPRQPLLKELSRLRNAPNGRDLARWIEITFALHDLPLSPYRLDLPLPPPAQTTLRPLLHDLESLRKRYDWHPGIAYHHGLAMMSLGRYPEALRSLNTAAAWNPLWPAPHAALMRLAMLLQHPQLLKQQTRELRSLGLLGEEILLRLQAVARGIAIQPTPSPTPQPSPASSPATTRPR